LGNSYHGGDGHGGADVEGQNGHPSVAVSDVAPTFEDDDEENGDGIQLAKVCAAYHVTQFYCRSLLLMLFVGIQQFFRPAGIIFSGSRRERFSLVNSP
jgi:hypothetical protein